MSVRQPYPTPSSGITVGTTTITGGTDTRVLFNDGGFVGEDAGLTFNKTTDILSSVGLNLSGLTASRPIKTDASKNLSSGLIDLASANDVTGLLPLANAGDGASNAETTVTTTGTINALAIATNKIRLTASSTTTVNGIANDGTARSISIRVLGSGATFNHQNASASAANRLSLSGSAAIFVPAGYTITFNYSTAETIWYQSDLRPLLAVNNNNSLYTILGGNPAGANNLALGNEALNSGTMIGATAVFLGYRAGRNINGSAANSVVIGASSALVVTGQNNVVLGADSAPVLSSGQNNALVGRSNSLLLTTGSSNASLGGDAFPVLSTGSNNTAVGQGAGAVNTTGSSNLYLGSGSGALSGSTNLSNSIAIGANTRVSTSNTLLLGGTPSAGTAVNVGINVQSPSYRLHVGGDINVGSGFVFRINGVAQTPWLLIGNASTSPGTNYLGTSDFKDFQLRTNASLVQVILGRGLTGFRQSAPSAIGHFGSVTASITQPASLSAYVNGVSATGYAIGSGNKNYSVHSVITVGAGSVYSAARTGTFTEPADSGFSPSGGVANSQDGSGYDPNSVSPPSYEVWALFVGDAYQSPVTTTMTTDGGTWADTNNNKDVAVSWTAPANGSASSYYVVRDGTDFRNVGATTSFLDDNTGWSGGGAPGLGSPNYTVRVEYPVANGSTSYRVLNTTATTYTNDTTPNLFVVDDTAWTAGTPTTTPTSAPYPSVYADNYALFSDKITLSSIAGSTTAGDLWQDSTQKALQTFVAGIEQTISGVVFTQTADKTIANTTTETTLIGTGVGTVTLPANFFTVGKTIRFRFRGIISDTGTPTVQIKIKLGATTIADSGTVALILSTLSNDYFEVEGGLTCRTTGATGTVISSGVMLYDKNANASNAIGIINTGTTTIDTTASQAFDVTFDWGTASASNTITSQIGTVEVLN